MGNQKTVRVFVPLPDELVVLEVPMIETHPKPYTLEATQLPFPPTYDPTGQPIQVWPPKNRLI